MNVASCPACGGTFENDIRLSGQVIECPYCRLPMQMPYAAPVMGASQTPPAESVQAIPETSVPRTLAKATLYQRRRRDRPVAIGMVVAWAGWVCGGVLGAYLGLWILRTVSPAAFESITTSAVFLRPLVERLP